MSISDNTIEAIKDSVKTEVIEVGGKLYTTRQVFETSKPEPEVKPLTVHTLTGLAGWVNGEFDGDEEGEDVAIHVESHSRVSVIGEVRGQFHQRNVYLVANSEPVLGPAFKFGQFYDSETFIIALQTLFVLTDEVESVLRVVGNIKEEDVRQAADDGFTQTVTARAGIARVESVEVPNPVTLQPYRTFREIDQPTSPFVLRLREGGGGSMPQCALFEADGGLWRLEAIKRIKSFLEEIVDGVQIIA